MATEGERDSKGQNLDLLISKPKFVRKQNFFKNSFARRAPSVTLCVPPSSRRKADIVQVLER